MRALLTPEIAPRLGVVLFRPGAELMQLFRNQRVLIEDVPENLRDTPSGMLPPARQPLAQSGALVDFFATAAVIHAAGGMEGMQYQLMRSAGGCQWPHSDYHHAELTPLRRTSGVVRLCWSCDNRLRDQATPELDDIAASNRAEWVIDRVRMALGFGDGHAVTLPELCWWAVINGVADSLPESAARAAMMLPPAVVESGPFKESDLAPPPIPARELLQQRATLVQFANIEEQKPPAFSVTIDPESPETFMRRPKRRRWQCEKYLAWVRAQPCVHCGAPADDAHHLIGYGQGGTGTKAHDLFTIPLCRVGHQELHRDPAGWESEHGSQLLHVVRTLDRALALGVIATNK